MTDYLGGIMHKWARDLFPICRSLTGTGTLETLHYFQNLLPELQIRSVASGTAAFDWNVPDEWNIKDAYVADETGKRVIDFKVNNLHVVGYSEPVDQALSFAELDNYLYSLPSQPHAIPYVTSYYQKRWGFCLSDHQRSELKKYPDARYHVKIDSTLAPGVLNYAELVIPGKTEKEIFFSTYVCHPSMANNELSGPCVTTQLARWIYENLETRRYTYRIVFIPETIGSIVYLSRHWEMMKKNIIAGYVVTCVGDERAYSYVPSRMGDTLADAAAMHVLKHLAPDYIPYTFLSRGSDERQYCSPGIDLPVCSVCRSKYGEYPEYHTSLDNLELVTPAGLQGAFEIYRNIISVLEANATFKSAVKCEPQLGKRGLYPTTSTKETKSAVQDLMNLIAYADGDHTLLEIADKTETFMGNLAPHAEKLLRAGLFEKVEG